MRKVQSEVDELPEELDSVGGGGLKKQENACLSSLSSYKKVFKIIMLGKASCGKTSLLVRFVDSEFGN